MHEEKVMDVTRLGVRAADLARPPQFWRGRSGGAGAPTLARPPHDLSGNFGPICPFLIRLKARLLGNLKEDLGDLKDNLETF